MGSIFSKPKMPEFIAPPAPPEVGDTAAKEAAAREMEKIKRKMARRGGTIYTGPGGMMESPTTLKQKLG